MEEIELFKRYFATHDIALRNEIVERNLFIASMLAKKFAGRGVEYDDLFQVASLALMKGVDRFDPEKGVKFSTFITPTITGEIKNYFRDRSRLVHLPRKISTLRAEIRRVSDEMQKTEGRAPTVFELSKKLNISEEEIVSAMEAGCVISLDKPLLGGEGEVMDLIPASEDFFEHIEKRDAVEAALKELSKEERALVSYRFGQELSQTETAKKMSVSQMYVSRMERRVLEKLRGSLKASF